MEFFSNVLMAMYFAMGAIVFYRAILSTSRLRDFLSLERDVAFMPN